MNVLILSLGGGGGNVLRSLKTIVQRDLTVTQQTDVAYADRLRQRIATRFLDTNEFSLSDVPPEERLLIGTGTTGRLGSGHNPDVARAALEESRSEVEALLSQYSAAILIGTGGKGTGAGTIFPVAEMARLQKKLVIPVFIGWVRERTGSFDIPVFAVAALSLVAAGAIAWLRARPGEEAVKLQRSPINAPYSR